MFGLFKKKSEKEKLQEKYEKLLKESYELSKTNRKESDKKAYEADLIAKKIGTNHHAHAIKIEDYSIDNEIKWASILKKQITLSV